MKVVDQIIENNSLDIDLYKYVKINLVKHEMEKYLSINNYKHIQLKEIQSQRAYWKLFRNFYYGPIIRILRVLNGLSAKGSY